MEAGNLLYGESETTACVGLDIIKLVVVLDRGTPEGGFTSPNGSFSVPSQEDGMDISRCCCCPAGDTRYVRVSGSQERFVAFLHLGSES